MRRLKHGVFRLIACAHLLLCAVSIATPSISIAGPDLDAVKRRDIVRCGVSGVIAGFASQDASGQWSGMEVDFCRALAAAALGDARKVQFVPMKASGRFPALQAKTIDVLMRNTTWTLTREALLKVQFAAVLFYDGQAFLVPKGAGIKSLRDLDGAVICVVKATTHEIRLPDYFASRGWNVKPLVIDSVSHAVDAFRAGRCNAYTSDASQLAGVASPSGDGQEYVLLPERISKEPLGPVVSNGDAEWAALVRWVAYVLIAAEENGATRADVEAKAAQKKDVGFWRVLSGRENRVARTLGVAPQAWMRAVKAVGNYGEIYERHFGASSRLPIERGLNRQWTEGGLLYAPPIE